MLFRTPIAVVISATCLAQSCGWLNTKHYKVDKPSPTGIYRVKVAVTVKDEGDFAGHFTDQGSIQVLKGTETVYAYDWNYRDNWDPSFIDRNPVIEWVGNNVLRMGGDNSKEPFSDELIISNETSEHVKHIGVSCGKYEHFDVFDLSPRGEVVLRPSPGLNPDVSGNISWGYGVETQSGKAFQGAIQQKQPSNSIKVEIKIRPEEIH